MISREAKELQQMLFSIPARDDIPIREQRRMSEKRFLNAIVPENIETELTEIGEVPCEVMRTPNDTDEVLLFIHGGGFTKGSHLNGRHIVPGIIGQTGQLAILPDYRLAPENPYPCGLEDCICVYRTLLKKYPSQKIAVLGVSAGGNIALAMVLLCAGQNIPLPKCIVVASPPVGRFCDGMYSHETRQRRDCILKGDPDKMYQAYAPETSKKDPLVFPIHGNYEGFPRTQIHVSTEEVLYDDGILLAQRMTEQGVSVDLRIWDGLHHAFMTGNIPEAEQAWKIIAEYVMNDINKDEERESE